MEKPRQKLTKRVVESASPDGRDYFIWCDELPGFGIRIFASGRRSYLVQYRADGRTRRVTIGLHGPVTCDEARKQAMMLLGKVATGENPADDREESRKAMTVKQLCDAYFSATEKNLILGKKGLPKKQSTLATDRGRVTRHILPLLGTRKVQSLTTPDIIRFMRDVSAGKTAADVKTGLYGRAIVKGGKGTAARTVGLLGGILSFAVSEGVIPFNPANGVKRPADGHRKVRLSVDQYRALGLALYTAEVEGERWQVIAAVKLLALTGCRRGEICNLRWDDVDIKGSCLRLSDSKTGKSVRPIGSAVIKILQGLSRLSDFVFPGTMLDKPYSGLPKVWPRIIARAVAIKGEPTEDEIISLDKLTVHGFRHAFGSVANDLGFTEATVAAMMGQSTGTIPGRYIHHVDTALISAADRVSSHISAAMYGKTDNTQDRHHAEK